MKAPIFRPKLPAESLLNQHEMTSMDVVIESIRNPKLLQTKRLSTADITNTSERDVEIDLISTKISYLNFFSNYLVPNKPCVFGPWLTAEWRCRKEWILSGGGRGGSDAKSRSRENSSVGVDYPKLSQLFGDAVVPVANCRSRQYDAQIKSDWTFAEYLVYLEGFDNMDSGKRQVLYCKDWHFCREFRDYVPYETPVFFASDWLNQYWDGMESDDYRFVYIGPSSSWTPFHADVLRSYSWSANVFGSKTWYLFPKGAEEVLRDERGSFPFDARESCQNRSFRINQECGETIFVPSGWFHQVHNGDDISPTSSANSNDDSSIDITPSFSTPTISVNHNWLNGCNVDLGWNHLQECLCDVKTAISDCCDMDGYETQCQLILKANEGMDYSDFYQFLRTIGLPILRRLGEGAAWKIGEEEEGEEIQPGSRLHDLFDLSRISHCLSLMTEDDDFDHEMELSEASALEEERLSRFLADIDQLLEKRIGS